jgi:hypothetical protein
MDDELPRGVRNNNPLNIRLSNISWEGEIIPNTDGSFVQFSDATYGIRAGAKILTNYCKLDGLSTLRDYINRWAPSSENDTNSYLNAVCQACNSDPDDSYDVTDPAKLGVLVSAIIQHENGQQPYSQELIESSIQLA